MVDVLQVLAAAPSPRGQESATAHRLQQWAAARWPALSFAVEPVGETGANLVAAHAVDGPLLYSHLDTSLSDSSFDSRITGRDDPAGDLRVDAHSVEGFGLTVARAPAAVALAAFVRAGRGRLLLAGSGTHRRGGGVTGVSAYLDAHPPPPAVIVAKCGPPGVLWEEPGAAYLTVRVAGRSGVALLPESADPPGGVLQHAGVVLDAIARWRANYLAAAVPVGQVGAACGIGAVSAGWPDKPDLLPAALEVSLYVVTVPGADMPALGRSLAEGVRAACASGPLAACSVDVDAEIVHAAAATAADHPLVARAREAWSREFGPPADIAEWAGTTDGVVFRGRGIPTVRLGPAASRSPDHPARDVLPLAQLTAFARIYRRLLDG